jgi:hypothetical protein
MNAYEAARAAEILGLEALPDRLTIEQIAILQVGAGSLWEKERSTWRRAMRAAINAGDLRQDDGKITAAEFKRWMLEYGGFPSMMIEGWFALHARERKSPGGEKWTPEKLDELRAYRDEFGTKAAARQFGISEARIRQLLPTEKPPAAWLMPEKRTVRKRKT